MERLPFFCVASDVLAMKCHCFTFTSNQLEVIIFVLFSSFLFKWSWSMMPWWLLHCYCLCMKNIIFCINIWWIPQFCVHDISLLSEIPKRSLSASYFNSKLRLFSTFWIIIIFNYQTENRISLAIGILRRKNQDTEHHQHTWKYTLIFFTQKTCLQQTEKYFLQNSSCR